MQLIWNKISELFLQNHLVFVFEGWTRQKKMFSCKNFEICHFVFLLQLQENQDEIENMMNAIFKGVFVHRYR